MGRNVSFKRGSVTFRPVLCMLGAAAEARGGAAAEDDDDYLLESPGVCRVEYRCCLVARWGNVTLKMGRIGVPIYTYSFLLRKEYVYN